MFAQMLTFTLLYRTQFLHGIHCTSQQHVTAPFVSAFKYYFNFNYYVDLLSLHPHSNLFVIGAHSISSCYCVSFPQHKCFIDKKSAFPCAAALPKLLFLLYREPKKCVVVRKAGHQYLIIYLTTAYSCAGKHQSI